MIQMKKKFKTVIGAIRKVIEFFKSKQIAKKIYEAISIISTLTIFTGLICFILGKITNNNQSDNDLVMQQIKNEICEDERIVNVETADIHGFGNNSIIVTACNAGNAKWEDDSNNSVIIMDIVENEMLQSMNDLLGVKSNYKTTFVYSIDTEGMKLYPIVNSVSDIIGDSTKELLIDYQVWGSTYGAYFTAVFRYSYENERYEIVGTYPIVEKADTTRYDDNGNIVEVKCIEVDTKFNDVPCENNNICEFSDSDRTFNLTIYSGYCRDYWGEFSNLGKTLIVVKGNRYDEKMLINCYQPIYKEKENVLIWNTIYSEYTSEISLGYTKDDLARYLEKKYDCEVDIY